MWSLSLIKQIILSIFTIAKYSLNLAYHLLMAFNNLEKRKTKNFLEKQYACVHPNIDQKPSGATLIHNSDVAWFQSPDHQFN